MNPFESFFNDYSYMANNKSKSNLKKIFADPGKFSYEDLMKAINDVGGGQNVQKRQASSFAGDKSDDSNGSRYDKFYNEYLGGYTNSLNVLTNDFLGRQADINAKRQSAATAANIANPNEATSAGEEQSTTTTVTTGGTPDVNPEANEQTYDPEAGRYDASNLGRFGGRADRFGMRDLLGAYNSGYSQSDVMRFLSLQDNNPGWRDQAKGGYNSEAPAYQALQEVLKGQISTKFLNPDYFPDSSTWSGPASNFGDADLLGNRKAGFTDQQILEFLDNNLGLLKGVNRKGETGGIYERLNANRFEEGERPKQLMIGSAALGNSGTASGVRPKRSIGSQSGSSNYGTSQYNRKNFGNAAKSPLTITGLNI